MANIKLATWIQNFKEGKFDHPDFLTQCDAGWYDWFCKDTSLVNKTKRMGSIIKQIKEGGKINLEKTFVWFKNNFPLNGPLYDAFFIADIETGDGIYTVGIGCPWDGDEKYKVYGKENKFMKPIFATESSRELVKWFNDGGNA